MPVPRQFSQRSPGRAVTDHINDLLHAKSIEVDLEFYENSSYYDALHRAQEEAARPTRIVNGLAQIGVSGVALTGIAFLMFSLHTWIAGVLVLAALPGLIARLGLARKEYGWRRQNTLNDRLAAYVHGLLTWEYFAKEIGSRARTIVSSSFQ